MHAGLSSYTSPLLYRLLNGIYFLCVSHSPSHLTYLFWCLHLTFFLIFHIGSPASPDFSHNFSQHIILPDTFGNYLVMTPHCVNRNNWVFLTHSPLF